MHITHTLPRSLRPTEVLAYVLDYLARSSQMKDDVVKTVKTVNDHHRELYLLRKCLLRN